MNYTRIDGEYKAQTPWGESIVAQSHDILIHKIDVAHKRELQRRTIVEREERQRKAKAKDLSGTVIARQARHYTAVIDGVTQDIWDCFQKMVYGYWSKSA